MNTETKSAVQNIVQSLPAIEHTCPNCAHPTVHTFFETDAIPSHSCLLMNSPEQAREFPVGDLQLGFCPSCGFIMNTRCNPALQQYSTSYEETQHFSETFNRFAKSLAQQWIDQYDIRNKLILEIGCGKAEFLELMCKLGDNRGIGVDPSVIPERLPAEIQERIDFYQEYYATKHAQLEADVILCRHTLEHIIETRELMQTIRESIGDRDTLVLFELPDATRVLRERAFWDVYYEHCSYFTAGSLARVFRECGFEVIDLERCYDDQYLLIAARPAAGPTAASLPLEDDLESTARDVMSYATQVGNDISNWQTNLRERSNAGERIIAWGAGSKCVSFFTTLNLTDEIDYAVDINPHKQGQFVPGTGHRVLGPDDLTNEPPNAVVVMNAIYCDEIQELLNSLSLGPELLPLQ